MARYILVFHADEAAWDDETPEEKAALYAAHGTFMERLAAVGGRVRGGAELKPSSTTRTVRAGTRTATDGPFAEVVEQVSGFLDVECDDEAGLLAAVGELTQHGESVEVRGVVTDEEREAGTA